MIVRERYLKKPNAGIVAWNTDSDIRGSLRQVAINPSVETTTYDFQITDDADTIIFKRANLAGTVIENIGLGLYGIHTLNLSNTSTSNYSFTVTLLWDENVAP